MENEQNGINLFKIYKYIVLFIFEKYYIFICLYISSII